MDALAETSVLAERGVASSRVPEQRQPPPPVAQRSLRPRRSSRHSCAVPAARARALAVDLDRRASRLQPPRRGRGAPLSRGEIAEEPDVTRFARDQFRLPSRPILRRARCSAAPRPRVEALGCRARPDPSRARRRCGPVPTSSGGGRARRLRAVRGSAPRRPTRGRSFRRRSPRPFPGLASCSVLDARGRLDQGLRRVPRSRRKPPVLVPTKRQVAVASMSASRAAGCPPSGTPSPAGGRVGARHLGQRARGTSLGGTRSALRRAAHHVESASPSSPLTRRGRPGAAEPSGAARSSNARDPRAGCVS